MKKLVTVIVLALFLVTYTATVVFGNAYTLGAENGKLLSPAGLGLDLTGTFVQKSSSLNNPSALSAQLSYGISPALTVAGEISQANGNNQTLVKAYFGPMHKGNGYTAYLSYDLSKGEIPSYGLSLWSDSKLAFAFINLESVPQDQGSFRVTPGLNLRLGSKLRIGGEVEFKSGQGNYEAVRVGASYALTRKILAKINLENGAGSKSDRVYSVGLSTEL